MDETSRQIQMGKRVRQRLEEQLAASKAELDKFATRFAIDPANALDWAADAFGAAATAEVAQLVLRALEEGNSIERLTAIAVERALRAAQYFPRSTSPTGNLMEAQRGSAWAAMHRLLTEVAA